MTMSYAALRTARTHLAGTDAQSYIFHRESLKLEELYRGTCTRIFPLFISARLGIFTAVGRAGQITVQISSIDHTKEKHMTHTSEIRMNTCWEDGSARNIQYLSDSQAVDVLGQRMNELHHLIVKGYKFVKVTSISGQARVGCYYGLQCTPNLRGKVACSMTLATPEDYLDVDLADVVALEGVIAGKGN
jgi:hypothetical protein